MTKADLILLIMIIILGTGTFFLVKMLAREGKHVRVSVDGKVLMTVPLDKNDSYEIKGYDGGYNRLVIKDNKAYISEADCPDRLCVKQGRIGKEQETVICLPHRVVVEIIE
ncbi:MAG: NusG domain II-containing protein [Eubacterium sp.]|nr:NusG domain II-containing protein [Eubacterium sp.]MBR6218241.1 NusG domain II-containing protein [Eubacterium sp.]HBE09567.1 NusG domain II-containing protein [Lachnospiraceae bacterium]